MLATGWDRAARRRLEKAHGGSLWTRFEAFLRCLQFRFNGDDPWRHLGVYPQEGPAPHAALLDDRLHRARLWFSALDCSAWTEPEREEGEQRLRLLESSHRRCLEELEFSTNRPGAWTVPATHARAGLCKGTLP